MPTVKITRRYRSARAPHPMTDALSDAGWAALLTRIADMSPVRVEPYADDHGAGCRVTTTDQRGPGGAFALHDLACRYGALAVIEH